MQACLRTLNSFYLRLFKGKLEFESKRERVGEGKDRERDRH